MNSDMRDEAHPKGASGVAQVIELRATTAQIRSLKLASAFEAGNGQRISTAC